MPGSGGVFMIFKFNPHVLMEGFKGKESIAFGNTVLFYSSMDCAEISRWTSMALYSVVAPKLDRGEN